jgi:hypothetical protein
VAAGYYKREIRENALSSTSTTTTSAEGLRRVLRLALRAPSQKRVGLLSITEHPHAGTTVFESDRGDDPTEFVVRPGTCAHPTRGRGYHLSGSGEADGLSYDELAASSFAVEIDGDDGGIEKCAEHHAKEPLPADVVGLKSAGRAQLRNGSLIFDHDGLQLSLDSSANGRGTMVAIATDAAGSSDSHAHLRRGSCAFVAPGREWPILLRNNGNDRSLAVAVLPIPFRLIARGGWVYEEHGDLVGSAIYACVEL